MEESLIKDLSRTELPNKLQVWCRKLLDCDSISLRLMIMVGSAHQNLDDLGLAHFVEHLVFNFRKENASINKIYEEIQQSGGCVNAETGVSSTVFTADAPIIKLSKCLELISCCFLNPDFSERAINNERKIILNELDNQDDFWFKIYRKILGKHALTCSGIGTPQTLQKINKEKIKSFFVKNYVLNKMILICAGGISSEDLIQQIMPMWKNLPVNEERKIYHTCLEPKKKYIRVSEWRAESSVIYGYRICGTMGVHKEYYIFWFIRDYLRERLMEYARKKAMLYQIDVYYSPYNYFGILYIYVRHISRRHKDVIEQIESEITNLKTELIDQVEFGKSKDFTVNQFLGSVEGRNGLVDFYKDLVEIFRDKKDIKEPIEELRSLTPEEVRKVANEYFKKENGFLVDGRASTKLFVALAILILISFAGNIFSIFVIKRVSFVLKIIPFVMATFILTITLLIIERKRLLKVIDRMKKEKEK